MFSSVDFFFFPSKNETASWSFDLIKVGFLVGIGILQFEP